ncbi:hypothetical protein E4U30_006597 [Claviceps sp. LM220 group G6]|nr:hypothetical protein E4U30_006597 [Claviceps sp. LM220 group G6]
MDVFQVTGVTDQKTLANFAFGLVNTEKEDGDGTDGSNYVDEFYSDSDMAAAIDFRDRFVEPTAKLFKMFTRKLHLSSFSVLTKCEIGDRF